MTDEPKEVLSKQRIDLTPPMQSHILATALRVPGSLARLRPVLNPDFFDDTEVADIVAWAVNFWDEHKQVPSKEAIKDVFRDDRYAKLIKSIWKQELSDVEHTEQRICNYAYNRAMRIAIMRGGAIISAQMKGEKYKDPETGETDLDPVKLIEEAAQVGRGLGDIGDRWDQVMETNLAEILKPTQRDTCGTGLEHLDLAGVQIERGEMGCVLGASKRGKSHVLVNIALNAMVAGRNVVYYSLEMRNFRVFKRLYARLAGKKQDVKQDPQRFVDAVRARSGKLVSGNLVMKYFPSRTATVADLGAHLTRVQQVFKPDLVVVDYAGILRPSRERDEVRHNLESIFLDLRAMAAQHEVFLWTGAQANRGSVNKEVVTMADFSECFAIVQHIDVGFSISMTDAEKADGKGRFFVLASRNEQDGCIVPFEHDYSRSYIKTLSVAKPVAAKKPRATSDEERLEAAAQSALSREKKRNKDDEQP